MGISQHVANYISFFFWFTWWAPGYFSPTRNVFQNNNREISQVCSHCVLVSRPQGKSQDRKFLCLSEANMKRAGLVSYINMAMCVFQQVMLLLMFILGVGVLDPSPCISPPVSLRSSQKSVLFYFFWSNCYGHEIRKKTNWSASDFYENSQLWFSHRRHFKCKVPLPILSFLFLLSLWFLIIKQADSNQFFYLVIPSYLPKWHHQQVGMAKPPGSHTWSVFCMHVIALSSSVLMALGTVSPEQPKLCFCLSTEWRTN